MSHVHDIAVVYCHRMPRMSVARTGHWRTCSAFRRRIGRQCRPNWTPRC